MAKILITGAAGFIGYNLWEKLCANHPVIGIDNLTDFSNLKMKTLRLSHLFSQPITATNTPEMITEKGTFIVIDILDRTLLQSLFNTHSFDIVVHLAALTGIRPSLQHEQRYRLVNEEGFKNIVEVAQEHGVRKIIYASSSSVYGSCNDYPYTEESDTDHPLNPYASTKKNNELFAEAFAKLHDITLIGLRFFTVYGPWTRPDMATYNFIQSVLNNKEIVVFQQNHQSMIRDFTYIDDVCEAISLLIEKLLLQEKVRSQHNIYNIGGGEPIAIDTYVKKIGALTGQEVNVKKVNGGDGEMIKTFADCDKLFHFISFTPNVKLNEGLRKTIDWFKLVCTPNEG